jgi:hypothetical protein
MLSVVRTGALGSPGHSRSTVAGPPFSSIATTLVPGSPASLRW